MKFQSILSNLIILTVCATVRANFEKLTSLVQRQSANYSVQTSTVEDLLERLLKNDSKKFSIKIQHFNDSKDVFVINKINDSLVEIKANSAVAAASGVHYFLKYYCNSHISWDFNRIDIPEVIPDVINHTVIFPDRFRYYQNVCTASYSFVWWNWTDWERHIDWMALNSFNLVLAFNGQEEIWTRVYKKLNLTQMEIDEHFTGPAFLSWNRMGNLRGFGGPLSAKWNQRSVNLQRKILKRLRSFGIVPVLPAFSGIVPKSLKRLFPEGKFHMMPRWNKFSDEFCCPLLLDPTDSLFKTIGNLFLKEMIAEFGTNHLYNCDTFNEMEPFTNDTNYLKQMGASIYEAMTDVDPNAIWILQGWMFYSEINYWDKEKVKSLLQSIPLGKMLILDLQSEQFPQYDRLENYFGQPYIWCMLHNFGGTLGMFGSAEIINSRVYEARKSKQSTLIGTGLTPEGINQNYVIYDLMTEVAWRQSPIGNLTDWFAQFSRRRYGVKSQQLEECWKILQKTLYNYNWLLKMRGKFAFNRGPSTKIHIWTWYNKTEVIKAWKMFLKEGTTDEMLQKEKNYLHDLVDLTRQVLQNLADDFYLKMIDAFKKKEVEKFRTFSENFLEIFNDAEEILASGEKFLLGTWLESAKRAAFNGAEEILFEFNARNQISLWGPRGEIKDYANKQWSGMMSHLFKPRWSLFIHLMNDSLTSGTGFQESKAQRLVLRTVEKPFTIDRGLFPEKPTGDSVEIAESIRKKWKTFLEI